MERRKFLQLLTASAVAAAMPLTLISGNVVAKPGPRYQFNRTMQHFDYNDAIGLCVSAKVDEEKFRCAVATTTIHWEQMTPDQKEQMWRIAEQGCTRSIQRRFATA